MNRFYLTGAAIASIALAAAGTPGNVRAAEVIRLVEKNWDASVPQGKEVDCIYGDWVLRNDKIVAVIAEALPGRNANMTVRNVGGRGDRPYLTRSIK